MLKELKKIKIVFLNLYNIALSILSTPVAHVSVERLFSVFKWVYNERHSRLKENDIEDMLLLELNNYL